MSNDWVYDIVRMHHKFGVGKWFDANKDNKELMAKYLAFRMSMIKEEYDETMAAIENKDPEEIVDGLIDMCVFAIGTLDVFGVDPTIAWNKVYEANMSKDVGVKEGRPNKFGLPDLIKPTKETHGYDWVAPNHFGNHGNLKDV